MPLNLTLPGAGGHSKKRPVKGKIINKDKKDPAKEAEDVFNAAVNPNTANTALYRQHTGGAHSRTQQRTMTGASGTVPRTSDRARGKVILPKEDSWGWGRSKLGNVARALKRLTGN